MSTNKRVETPEIDESIVEAMSKTEQFFENNGKKLAYAIFALLLVAAVVFGYKVLVVEPQMASASEIVANAQTLFEQETPDYEGALYGNDNGAGFLEVIEKYGSTPAGNLAKHYAGICFLHANDLESAKSYLSQYKEVAGIPAEIINAQNFGLQGDIAVNESEYKQAISLYTKAFNASDNALTAPLYMRKAAVIAMESGDNAKAKSLLQQIISQYPNSAESRTAEKYMGAIE